MDAGSNLDAAIACRVFGMVPYHDSPDQLTCPCRSQPSCIHPVDPEPYSTDIAAAWGVVEHFHHAGACRVIVDARTLWHCTIYKADVLYANAMASTAPLAICLAALNALGTE
jgi:hypothetical protein